MQVINELTGKTIDIYNSKKVVIFQTEDLVVYGYISTRDIRGNCTEAIIFHGNGNLEEKIYVLTKNFRGKLFFGNNGRWYCTINIPKKKLLKEKYSYDRQKDKPFPYSFDRRYEAVENFYLFEEKQKIVNEEIKYPLSEFLDYTFGLEFETSMGVVPEAVCYRDGLIPLRDGSISGYEYSTVVMKGNSGLNLLRQQLETLKALTHFNKECSLHIHMGGFPLKEESIWRLYCLCYGLQCGDMISLLPPWTFNTAKYKETGKDYCKYLPKFNSFKDMYQGMVGRGYFGSLEQAHPQDIDRTRKWQIGSRYYWINFINLLCYKVNKTAEFRFLRPTYNYRRITLWLYVMNGILKAAEDKDGDWIIERFTSGNYNISIRDVLRRVYPQDIYRFPS